MPVPNDPKAFELTPSTLQGMDAGMAREASRLLELTQQLQSSFKTRDKLYQQIEEVIFLEQKVRIPKAYQNSAIEVRSPLAFHIMAQIAAALSINAPLVHFDPVGIGDSAEENASNRERFLMASWKRQEQEARRRLFRLFAYSVAAKGEGILKTVERTKRVWGKYDAYSKSLSKELAADPYLDDNARSRVYDGKTEEKKRGMPYPIATTDVPPETFYYIRGEDGISLAAEVKDIPYFDTLERYGASFDKQGRIVPQAMGLPREVWHKVMGTQRTIKMHEVWTWDQCQYVLQGPGNKQNRGESPTGLLVKTVKHGYGDKDLKVLRGPYFQAFGLTTSSREIHKQGVSVLFAFLHLFPLLNALLTMQSQSAYATAYPAYKRTVPNTFTGGLEADFGFDASELDSMTTEITPGTILPFDVAPIDQPHSGIDLDKAIANVRSMLDLALPDIAMGNVSGDTAGYAINQAAHLAKLAWTPIVDNMQFALAERTEFEQFLIEKRVRERVYVYGAQARRSYAQKSKRGKDGWLALGPDDIDGVYRCEVELRPETPQNELLNLRAIAQKLQMRLIAPNKAIEAAGEDPYEVKIAWLVDDLEKDPAIRKQLQNRTFKKLNTIDQQAMVGVEPPGATRPPNQPGTTPVAPGAAPPPAALGPGGAPGIMPAAPATGVAPVAPLSQVQPGRGVPGVPPGAPAGVRNPPANAVDIPGGG